MPWKQLLQPEIQAFMAHNRTTDVRTLGLKKPPVSGWPYPLILDQIKGRQKAAVKIPGWLGYPSIVLPASDILEQASSGATAQYKAGLIQGKIFADLTGGAGVDCFALSQKFESGHGVEQDENAASLLAHNAKILTQTPIQIHHARAEDWAQQMPPVDLVFIDPQRRSSSRKGFYRLEDCAPDIIALLPVIKEKTKKVMIKTSPMLDIQQSLNSLESICAVHVLEWHGECKEVVYIIDFSKTVPGNDIPITAVTLDDQGSALNSFTFTRAKENIEHAEPSAPLRYLYEPGPAFQKAGGFNSIAQEYRLKKLHTHTHLYTSDRPCPNFPGRGFEIIQILPVRREALSFDRANLSIRNFPSDVASLRKKLGLKDGGDDYVFACTLKDESRALIRCRKP